MDAKRFVDEAGGVLSAPEVAEFLEVPRSAVRDWASENGVRRIGPAFVFDLDAVERCAEDLEVDFGEDEDDADQEDDDEPDDEDELLDEEE